MGIALPAINANQTDCLAGCRVLIAEDEYLIAMDMADALSKVGCVIVGPVSTGEEGMRKLANERINLAILDIRLRDGEAYGLAEAIRARKIPIIFASGYDAEWLRFDFANTQFLSKPVDQAKLIAAAASAIVRVH
jgi:two-component SAPR family response regulator